jgi:hypothetical protein
MIVARESSNGRIREIDWDPFLTGLGTAMQGVNCVTSVAAWLNPISWPIALARLNGLYTCGTLAYDLYRMAFPGPDLLPEELNATVGVASLGFDIVGCAKLANLPRDPKGFIDPLALVESYQSCKAVAIEVAREATGAHGALSEALRVLLERVKAILDSGYGDIKITLEWDAAVDLDLHVVDPNGEEISYSHTTSASGGILDLDDTNGFGPENVYWPTNGAATGMYQVAVHYYGPSDGPPASFTITVYNFGNVKTFSGTVAPGQYQGIVSFQAGAEWGRIAEVKIKKPKSFPLK